MAIFVHPSRLCGAGSLLALLVLLVCWLAAPQVTRAQASRPSRISVRVVDEREHGLDGAEVRLYPFGYGSYAARGATDDSGTVEFDRVAPGGYQLEASKPDYQTVQERVDLVPGATMNYTLILSTIPTAHPAQPPGGLVSAAALAVPEAARKEFEAGMAGLDKDPAGSIEHFRKATKAYPNFAEAYAWLGLAYLEKRQNSDALGAEQKAITLNPKLAIAHTLLGKTYLEDRQYPQAESELLKGIELDPASWQALFDLSRCYFNMGKLDKALQYGRQANAVPQASPVTHLLLVDIYLRQGDKKDALEELQTFAKVAPESPLIPRVKQRIEQLSKPN